MTAESHLNVSNALIKKLVTNFDSLGRPTGETHTPSGREVGFTYPQNTPGQTVRTDTYGGIATTTTLGSNGLETTRLSTGAGISPITRSVSTRDTGDRETVVVLNSSAGLARAEKA